METALRILQGENTHRKPDAQGANYDPVIIDRGG